MYVLEAWPSRALRERRCVAAAVISGSVVSAACLLCVSDSLRCTFWIKCLTPELVNSKFYYCCWQLKQLRANNPYFCIFVYYFLFGVNINFCYSFFCVVLYIFVTLDGLQTSVLFLFLLLYFLYLMLVIPLCNKFSFILQWSFVRIKKMFYFTR